MEQKRKLLIGGVALVMGRLRGGGAAMVEICDELEPLLTSSGFLDNASFDVVSLIIRYGLVNRTKPEYQRINKRYSELPIAVELDMDMLLAAGKKKLKDIFHLATLVALIDVGKKYNLPIEALESKKQEVINTTGFSFD